MNSIGIVRRIDNLGRIVIPMEIRRNLKIKEGDPLELYVSDTNVIVRKFSALNNFGKKTIEFAESLSKGLKLDVLITDLDKVVSAGGQNREFYEGETCSKALIKTVFNRNVVHNKEKTSLIPIFLKDDLKFNEQVIVPIILNGDVYGSIICLDKEKIDNNKIQVVEIFANVIAKSIE